MRQPVLQSWTELDASCLTAVRFDVANQQQRQLNIVYSESLSFAEGCGFSESRGCLMDGIAKLFRMGKG